MRREVAVALQRLHHRRRGLADADLHRVARPDHAGDGGGDLFQVVGQAARRWS